MLSKYIKSLFNNPGISTVLQWVMILVPLVAIITTLVYFRDYKPITHTVIVQALEAKGFSNINNIELNGFLPCEVEKLSISKFSYTFSGKYYDNFYNKMIVCIDKSGEFFLQGSVSSKDASHQLGGR